MAGIDRWLHCTVTTIDRFHCIYIRIYVHAYVSWNHVHACIEGVEGMT